MYLKTKHEVSHNMATKYVQQLKKVIHLCIANEWMSSDPFKNFKCCFVQKDRGYLTALELETMTNKTFDIKRL